ncbi:unnamed protein product [Arabidopsis arenosa]|uniref:Malectin-like domain-containing protein n=1 Tax=Arabidopsis arenosa TaxID=38785 RepID=A0A8S2A1I3_ARAAE|nr:unnamed protein product [Arabidopsis arenosa]
MVVIVLLPQLTLSASSTYSRPEKFYINCGSRSNVTYGGRTFVGDMTLAGNYVFFTSEGTEAINQSESSNELGIYQTVRICKHPSSYKFQLDSVGQHFVRLHFCAVYSRTELLTAGFTISATSGSNHHLKSFSLQNFTETPRVEEFLLMIDSPEFEILFVPDHFDNSLHTIYRLNIGGEKITPENDTLGRTWSLDDDFLYREDSARNISSTQKPNYELGSATQFTAPDFVYLTAKTMNRSTSLGTKGALIKVTWSFKVKSNYRHFIRIHLCDILSESQNSGSNFYLYVNGQWRIDVTLSDHLRLMTPFYIDVVNISDGSGLLNVSLGTTEYNREAGFLNGVEVMQFLKKSDSLDRSSSRVYIIAVAVASFLVLGLLFIIFLKRRRSKNKKSDVEVTVWSPLPLYRGGGSTDNIPFYSDNNSPLVNLQLGLKIPFKDILRATNNFDEQWLIGKGGFGDVYKATLPDGTLNNNLPDEEVNLAEWAMSCKSKGIIDKIVDPKLTGHIEPISLRKFMEIAKKCLKENGDERPSMADVIWDLKYILRLQMIHEDNTATISSFGGDVGSLVNSEYNNGE